MKSLQSSHPRPLPWTFALRRALAVCLAILAMAQVRAATPDAAWSANWIGPEESSVNQWTRYLRSFDLAEVQPVLEGRGRPALGAGQEELLGLHVGKVDAADLGPQDAVGPVHDEPADLRDGLGQRDAPHGGGRGDAGSR